MAQAPLKDVPVHLITGFLGSGKSTLIRHLIDHKPRGETWAVLINEFGQVGIDQTLFEASDEVVVKGLPGGCLCCQLAFVLQATLVNLLHRHRPDRLIIEPSGLGHPAGLLDTLRGEAFQGVLDIRDIIAVLDPRGLEDSRVREHDTFHDQLAMADCVVMTMTDLATQAQVDAGQHFARALWPPRKWVAEAVHGQLPISLLIEGGVHRDAREADSRASMNPAHRELRHASGGVVVLDDFETDPPPGQPLRARGSALGYSTLGWRWHPADRFSLDALSRCLDRLPATARVKGVFHTEAGWKGFNRGSGVFELTQSQWRKDSRLELIGEAGSLPDADAMEAALQRCYG